MKILQVENPYGDPIEPEKAPEAISKAVATLPPEQMFELMKQMKLCIQVVIFYNFKDFFYLSIVYFGNTPRIVITPIDINLLNMFVVPRIIQLKQETCFYKTPSWPMPYFKRK